MRSILSILFCFILFAASAQDTMEAQLALIDRLEIDGTYARYLKQDAYTECDLQKMEEVLLAKINAYRNYKGLNELQKEDTACAVAREYSRILTSEEWLDHGLNGTTPSSRMQAVYVRPVWATENLNKWGCTIKPETTDELTDQILFCWINSKGHNKGLLEKGEYGAVGIHMLFNEARDHQTMVSAFNILYFR